MKFSVYEVYATITWCHYIKEDTLVYADSYANAERFVKICQHLLDKPPDRIWVKPFQHDCCENWRMSNLRIRKTTVSFLQLAIHRNYLCGTEEIEEWIKNLKITHMCKEHKDEFYKNPSEFMKKVLDKIDKGMI